MPISGKTAITIDYTKCGSGSPQDPRDCGICLRICAPAVFLLHETLGAVEKNPYDPQHWQVTALWLSLCTRCMKCADNCPRGAITVTWRG